MVYINRFFGKWDYESSDDKEVENCCDLIKKTIIESDDNKFKESKSVIDSGSNTNNVSEQYYIVNLNLIGKNKKHYKRKNIFK